jgi:PLD-like domain
MPCAEQHASGPLPPISSRRRCGSRPQRQQGLSRRCCLRVEVCDGCCDLRQTRCGLGRCVLKPPATVALIASAVPRPWTGRSAFPLDLRLNVAADTMLTWPAREVLSWRGIAVIIRRCFGLPDRPSAGVEIEVIGSVARRAQCHARKVAGTRRHTRMIIRDRRQAFVGSQSLRTAALDSRRELCRIVQDPKVVNALIETFDSDWFDTSATKAAVPSKEAESLEDAPAPVSAKPTAKAGSRSAPSSRHLITMCEFA